MRPTSPSPVNISKGTSSFSPKRQKNQVCHLEVSMHWQYLRLCTGATSPPPWKSFTNSKEATLIHSPLWKTLLGRWDTSKALGWDLQEAFRRILKQSEVNQRPGRNLSNRYNDIEFPEDLWENVSGSWSITQAIQRGLEVGDWSSRNWACRKD
jgi:hypothetical protein